MKMDKTKLLFNYRVFQISHVFYNKILIQDIDCKPLELCYGRKKTPSKIIVQFLIKSNEFHVLFWMNKNEITQVFERFYGAHPETKADFIIRIDAENKKYELALYRQGLKEPVVIPESAYQLIVFKNKFEDYRSENYNQPRGAWIW